MAKTKTRQLPKQGFRTFSFKREAINEDERRVSVSFSSEQPYLRYFGQEILLHDSDSVDLQRIKDIGVSLFNHNRDVVIGKLDNISLNDKEKRCYCDIIFDDDQASDVIYNKVKSGTLKGVSVGYTVSNWEEVEAGQTSMNGRFVGPCSIATKWTPFEVSIVSIPADDSVGVGREYEIYNEKQMYNKNERKKDMEKEEVQELIEKSLATFAKTFKEKTVEENKSASKDEELTKAVTEERQRLLGIAALCRDFDFKFEDYAEKSLDEIKDLALKAKTESMKAPKVSNNVRVTEDETDKFRDLATDGMLQRVFKIEKPADGSNEYRNLNLKRLAMECLNREGVENVLRMNDDELFKKALTPGGNFVAITDNIVNKSMHLYTYANTTFQNWTGKGFGSDFKDAKVYKLSEGSNLIKVAENGELKQDELKDEGVKKRVYTYGRRFGLTREAFINDDLNILTKVPQQFVAGAYDTVNTLVYETLTGTSNIYDGKPLFGAPHSNIAGSTSAITTEALDVAYETMAEQKGLKGKKALNLIPRYLICGPAKAAEAKRLLASTANPSSSNSGEANIYQGSLQLIVDGNLSGNAWYLAADSMLIDTIEVTYLNGKEAPSLESQNSFDRLGIDYRIYYDFGVNTLDYRGLFKNAGA